VGWAVDALLMAAESLMPGRRIKRVVVVIRAPDHTHIHNAVPRAVDVGRRGCCCCRTCRSISHITAASDLWCWLLRLGIRAGLLLLLVCLPLDIIHTHLVVAACLTPSLGAPFCAVAGHNGTVRNNKGTNTFHQWQLCGALATQQVQCKATGKLSVRTQPATDLQGSCCRHCQQQHHASLPVPKHCALG
jgi:hypothetical protein